MRNTGRTVSRHLRGALGVVALAFAGIGVFAGIAHAQTTIAVNPQTGLSDGQSVTVSGTDLGGNLVAVIECGNADENGIALPGSSPAPDGSDCFGAESILTGGTKLLTPDPSGFATTDYTVHDQGIGANNRQCIDNGNFDCLIVIADVPTMGQAIRISAPICFGVGCTVGPPPPAVVNPGLLPTTTLTGPGQEGPPGAAPPAPAVQAQPSFTG